MKWAEKPEIVSYIVDCYAGVEGEGAHAKRQFIWEQENRDVVIGNTRAFTDHLRRRFGLPERPTSWTAIHEVLRALGEVAHTYSPRVNIRGAKFKNQEPETRILKKGGS